MTKWEHYYLHGNPTSGKLAETAMTDLNRLGAQGWEAVAFATNEFGVLGVLLKRPVPEP